MKLEGFGTRVPKQWELPGVLELEMLQYQTC